MAVAAGNGGAQAPMTETGGAAGATADIGAGGAGGAVSYCGGRRRRWKRTELAVAGSGALKPLTVWIAGDSTVMSYTAANQASAGAALAGWGRS